jgi:signal transduction histidine kinase
VARVEEMIGRERAFSAEVSHQLRTPLTGLRPELESAHAALAAEPHVEPEPDGESHDHHPRRAVERSLQAVDRLERTVADVIRLARDLPAGQHTPLSGLLEAASNRWHGPLAAASRPLRVVADPQAPEQLRISTAAATQILDILLDNACRHGRGAVTVRVRGTGDRSAAGDTVTVEVSDDGPPLAVEAWQLFRPRDWNSATDEGPAHGIGLPYARRLAEAGGRPASPRRCRSANLCVHHLGSRLTELRAPRLPARRRDGRAVRECGRYASSFSAMPDLGQTRSSHGAPSAR